jgi:hypothetical protein
MNVFVLCTGRCGSQTFAKACKHITNYTSGHESRQGLIAAHRLNFPDNHIEADNRLSWMLGLLEESYGDRAFYVHLIRDESETAASFARRYDTGIVRAYRDEILQDCASIYEPYEVCKDLCRTVTANVQAFLDNKSNKLVVRLEHACNDFSVFWNRIGAEGDLTCALDEWNHAYNASSASSGVALNSRPLGRVARKTLRLAKKLPFYIKWA